MRSRIVSWCMATLVAAGVGAFVFGGFYDLTAVRQHPWWVYRGLGVVREAVVAVDAADVELPADFAPRATPRGAALFQKHCAQCHGAPGVAPEEFALGMMPVPPNPVAAARERQPEEIYWFIRYGLKMSGMPAWDLRMSDADMWRVTAFVEALPTLWPSDYAALLESAGGPADAVVAVADAPADGIADPERGRRAMLVHACRSCHLIPGIVGRPGVGVGPSLAEAGTRRYIAGVLPNTPDNMARWIANPQQVDPLSAMPNLGVPPELARDMAAYLYLVATEERRLNEAVEEDG